jgi:hypothetical protein
MRIERRAKDASSIANQADDARVETNSLDDLLGGPSRVRVNRDVRAQHSPAFE